MSKTARGLMWIVLGILIIGVMILLSVVVVEQTTITDTTASRRTLVQSIQETNTAVEKLITATAIAKTQAAGK